MLLSKRDPMAEALVMGKFWEKEFTPDRFTRSGFYFAKRKKVSPVQAKTVILDDKSMQRAIARISYEIIEHNKGVDNLCIIGILSRGMEIAGRIAAKIYEVEGKQVEVGTLDITRFRDDKRGLETADRSEISFSIEGKRVVLVDDVIFTGRSVRAAIDALVNRGRPDRIELAVLVDRGHRELPIRADFVGKNLPTSLEETVRVLVKQRDGEDKVVILKEEKR